MYADLHLRAFDCSNIIDRARFGQQRALTEPDIIREEMGRRRGFKAHPLYIETPLGAFVDHRRGQPRAILVKSTLREKGDRCENSTILGSFPMTAVTGP